MIDSLRDFLTLSASRARILAHPLRLVAAVSLLTACAQAPVHTGETAATKSPQESRVEPLPQVELTGKILYQTLLAEIAGQRGNLGVSASVYLDLARSTRDPRLARRAAEIALHGRDLQTALQAAQLWIEIDPESPQALQMLAGLLVSANRLEEVQPLVARLLALEGDNLGNGLMRLNRLFARHPDKKAVMQIVEQLTLPYIDRAEAHFARAQAALNANAWSRGVTAADQALRLRPDWDQAVLLKAQLQHNLAPQAALETLKSYLDRHGEARDVRLQYARALTGTRNYDAARRQFQRLLQESPDNDDVAYAVAVLSVQLSDWTLAEEIFKKLLDHHYAESDTVRLYLGQIAEERQQYDAAIQWYAQIDSGAQYLSAQMRIAQVLARQGKLAAARRHLQELRTRNEAERIPLLMAESQLLNDAGQTQAAFDLLDAQLAKQADQPELLYETALLADRLGHYDTVETRLRRLIQLKPDHAHAYNALGYSFADRKQNLAEAEQLIAKALQLSPADPFILDSMGWVLYRKGDSAAALEKLQQAYALRADPEIAAHLGEVLWMLNRRSEARSTWQEAARAHPDNAALIETIKRFMP